MAPKTNEIKAYYDASPGVHNAIKTLRTNIKFSAIDREIKTLVLTSVLPNEGKTTLTIYLGIAMAESGLRTLILNTDCYKPFLAAKLGVQNQKSWLDVLYGDTRLEEAITETTLKNLYFLESDVKVANPVELVGSNRFNKMVDTLRTSFDAIILDTPPLGTFIEAALLASKADGTILVIDSVGVDEKKAIDVVEQLKKANAKILGVVLNNVTVSEDDYYGYYNYQTPQARRARNGRDKRTARSDRRNTRSERRAR